MKSPSQRLINRSFIILVILVNIVLTFWLSGCSPRSDQSGGRVLSLPQEPGEAYVVVQDARSDGENGNWMTQYIVGGTWADTWFVNQYERPFSAGEMIYQPYLDIQEARLRPAGEWTVFEIKAVAPPLGQRAYISLEIDTDLDNRPDLLILTRAMEDTSWNDLMITILIDLNKDAGGNRPRLAEPFEDIWNGFEESLDADQISAYVRLSPDSDSTFQIAVFNGLLDGDQFIWRVWLEGEIYRPGWVEYNDRLSLEQAGSPYLYSPNYPLKNLASLDNTCLHFFGGKTNQPQPGFCDTIIDLAGEVTLPPDDQFANPNGENPVSIIFPGGDPGEGEVDPDPTLIVFDPGYFFQPTPTPYPILKEFPTMEFVVPETPDILVFEVVTPEIVYSVAETLVAEVVAETQMVILIPATDMFDPYAGYTPPPTEMFDPYQGSSPTPTPKPIIHFPTNTPAPTDKPIIVLKTATPTDKPIIILKTATPTP